MYVEINGWREILARIFAGFREQDNVSPEWLVNPATRRRLKLDKYYPDAGVAVRFVGLLAKGQGRQSDWDAMETEQRDQTRAELCRANGVQLVLIDAQEDAPKQLDSLIRTLSRASRTLAQSDRPPQQKQQWMPALSAAREIAIELRSRVAHNPTQAMASLAEAWRDRESSFADGATAALSARPLPPVALDLPYAVGARVQHERFGEGVITAMEHEDRDVKLVVLFDAAEERSFLASLVHEKLAVIA